MYKKLLAIAIVVVIAGTVATALYFKNRRFKVIISQQQIDAALQQKFPVKKTYLSVFTVTYSNPKVVLLDADNRVQVGLDAMLNIEINDEPKQLGGKAVITTGIRYDNNTQEFFLDDAVCNHLEIQGVPQRWLEPVTLISATVLRDRIETKPIYQIKAKDAKSTAAKWLLKGFDVRNQSIHVTLGL